MRTPSCSLAFLIAFAGCGLGEFEGGDDGESLAFGSDLYRRVVLARVYQKADWTLPQAGATVAEKVAYVCAPLRELRPTYVSGLIRLDDDSPLTDEQVAVFTGIRDCLRRGDRKVKVDVVLNAEHYSDKTRHIGPEEAFTALTMRADEIKARLGADIIFFDFFSSPYNDAMAHDGWYTGALTRGTAYIHDALNLRVGGNVWGLDPPPNADFVALDNFDREDPHVDGFVFNKRQIAALGDDYPVLLHIENNPQKEQSKGLLWMNGMPDYRREVIDRFASEQASAGYSYMFPVFFPLKCCVGAACGPDYCDDNPSDRIAYDASIDGNLLDKIDAGLGK